jgi:tetratricopeptide (TPR) repeat protein
VPAALWAESAWLHIADASFDHATVVEVGDRMTENGWDALPDGVLQWRANYAEALAAQGRPADARAVASSLAERATDVTTLAHAVRAGAAATAASGDLAGAIEELDAGVRLDPTDCAPLARARLELAAGSALRRAGRRARAAELLEIARYRCESIGALPWIERCERELAACG